MLNGAPRRGHRSVDDGSVACIIRLADRLGALPRVPFY